MNSLLQLPWNMRGLRLLDHIMASHFPALFPEPLLCGDHGEGLWGTEMNEIQSLYWGSSLEGTGSVLQKINFSKKARWKVSPKEASCSGEWGHTSCPDKVPTLPFSPFLLQFLVCWHSFLFCSSKHMDAEGTSALILCDLGSWSVLPGIVNNIRFHKMWTWTTHWSQASPAS